MSEGFDVSGDPLQESGVMMNDQLNGYHDDGNNDDDDHSQHPRQGAEATASPSDGMMMMNGDLNNSLTSMSVPGDLQNSFASLPPEEEASQPPPPPPPPPPGTTSSHHRSSDREVINNDLILDDSQQVVEQSNSSTTYPIDNFSSSQPQSVLEAPAEAMTASSNLSTPNAVSETATPQSHNNSDNNHSSNSIGDQKQSSEPAEANAGDSKEDDDSVIEILDDDDDDDDDVAQQQQQQPPTKRQRFTTSTGAVAIMPPTIAGSGMQNSFANRAAWMTGGNSINPGQTLSNGYAAGGGGSHTSHSGFYSSQQQPQQHSHYHHHQQRLEYHNATTTTPADPSTFDVPEYVELPSEFVPTWTQLLPEELIKPPSVGGVAGHKKAYKLSLLNVSEFTITGIPPHWDHPPTPISGLRAVIKRVSREHGQAVFEKDPGGGGGTAGKWRIPIGAYNAFVTYLKSDVDCVNLELIPHMQLKIASLGKARLEKDYPTTDKLMEKGVPYALANTLAPFQRGGVDFVLEKDGRALIADDMGLGKTIQSIASMSVYHKEWPLLILTPSGARYHWEAEFRNWLGVNGAAVKKAEAESQQKQEQKTSASSVLGGRDKTFNLLRDSQINVLTSSKVPVLPHKGTRVVICSYGLAPMLVQDRKIVPGMFACAIADESHMMKNSKSKRTQFLLPILRACRRCILLSGTPALAKPQELWPQLQILQSNKLGFWDNESEFIEKYVKNGDSDRRAELHAMLTGTLMIRRLKDDILKDMPKKAREKAILRVESAEMRNKMQECMVLLRQGKGVMAKLARQHTATSIKDSAQDEPQVSADTWPSPEQTGQSLQQLLNGQRPFSSTSPAEAALEQEMLQKYQQGHMTLQHTLRTTSHSMDQYQINNFLGHKDQQMRNELQVEYHERLLDMRSTLNDGNSGRSGQEQEERPTRASVLNKMYCLTGESKIPLVSDFLSRWLGDRTKGKICVFAHHITVLDAIQERVGLDNSGKDGTFRYIRIDGKTSPKSRQEQITRFQDEPDVRVALLGITAAGVAVTLTAASQVLFAELFWTPALMIQAEDRCHRIGQRARVHCKYFVATGTLDEILWKLIEKKFRELGEFVEGKEKLKMIVHKVYKNQEELNKVFEYEDEEGDDDDDALQADQAESRDNDFIPLDMELEHDIEELGKEEQAMVLGDRDEDDLDGDPTMTLQDKPAAVAAATALPEDNGPGRSEEDAIALSDDDEDDDDVEASIPLAVDLENPEADLNVTGSLPDCRIYKLVLNGPSMGVEVGLYKDRIVVSKRMPSRLSRLGDFCKPHVGDILVAVDKQIFPKLHQLDPVLRYLKRCLQKPEPATLWFVEDRSFHEFYKNVKKIAHQAKKRALKSKPKPTDEVVELLDD